LTRTVPAAVPSLRQSWCGQGASSDEIRKALKVKAALSEMLDQMQ